MYYQQVLNVLSVSEMGRSTARETRGMPPGARAFYMGLFSEQVELDFLEGIGGNGFFMDGNTAKVAHHLVQR